MWTSAVMPRGRRRPGCPGCAARMAAWPVPPPVSVTMPAIASVAQAHRLAGQDLVGDEDDRLVAVGRAFRGTGPGRLRRQVRADPRDHVADVGHPLAEVVVLDPGEGRGVILKDRLQCRERRQVLDLDQVVDLGQQRLVVDDLQVAPEDLASAGPSCWATFGTIASSSAAECATARSNRSISAGTRRRVGEQLRLARAEDRVDPVGDPTTTPGLTAIPLCITRSV